MAEVGEHLNLTPLRERVLGAMAARGNLVGQALAYEFATARRKTLGAPFKTPQQATRWSAAFMAPMVRAGYVERSGCGLGGTYRLTPRGRAALAARSTTTEARAA